MTLKINTRKFEGKVSSATQRVQFRSNGVHESYKDYDAITNFLEAILDGANTMFTRVYTSDNGPGEICIEIEGWDSTDGDCIMSIVFDEQESFEDTIGEIANELEDYASDFDPEEEANKYMNANVPGTPSLRKLLKAMDERKADMVALADAVRAAYNKM